jgi:polysaccharide export outer membrane protein
MKRFERWRRQITPGRRHNARRGTRGFHLSALVVAVLAALWRIADPVVVHAEPPAVPTAAPIVAPAMGIGEYVLGPEDHLTVALLGAAEYPEFGQPISVPVRPDGRISLGRIGEFSVTGKTTAQVKTEIEHALLRLFRRPPVVSISLTGFRQAGLIYVVGEVPRANAFPFRAGMGALEALALAGGSTVTANLKRVTIVGGDGTSRDVDLSLATQQGDARGNIPLRPGDVVTVPRLERRTVTIIGGVSRPGPYDILEDVTVLEALKLAEGPRERADLKAATITTRDGKTLPVDLEKLIHDGKTDQNLKLGDGDVLYVPERLIRVYVAGEVAKPTPLILRDGATLVEAITECGWFTREADLKQVRIGRRRASGDVQTERLDLSDLKRTMTPAQIVALQDGDFVFVPSRTKKKKPEDVLQFLYPLDVVRRLLFP